MKTKWVKGENLDVFMKCAWLLTDENDKPLGRLTHREHNWRGWNVAVLGDRVSEERFGPDQVAHIIADTKAQAEHEIRRLRALYAVVVTLSASDVSKLALEKCEDPRGMRFDQDCGACRTCFARRERRYRLK